MIAKKKKWRKITRHLCEFYELMNEEQCIKIGETII